jgi:hypothetical protein
VIASNATSCLLGMLLYGARAGVLLVNVWIIVTG